MAEPRLTPQSEARLVVEGLSVEYGGVTAVRDAGFRVEAGESIALLGPNGAGKSSTIKAVAGLVRPTAGTVRLDGADITDVPAEQRARRGVSVIPEGRGIFPRLTVEQNLLMGTLPSVPGGAPWERSRARRQLVDASFGSYPLLAERRSQRAGSLSGGEQAILALARAVIGSPRLLLLDEPSLGLAPRRVQELFDELERLASGGLSIVVVEQYVPQALRVASRALLLERGVIAFDGPAADLASDRRRLARSYLGGRQKPAAKTVKVGSR